MKLAAACLLVTLGSAEGPALAQAPDGRIAGSQSCLRGLDPVQAQCSSRASRELAQIPESRATDPRSDGMPALGRWLFTETTSPVDYSPIAIASITAVSPPDDAGMKFSIACRGGNTSLTLTAPGLLPAGGTYTVSYAVDDRAPVTLPAAASSAETATISAADGLRFLLSLPVTGTIEFRIIGRRGAAQKGRYALADLSAARERMVLPCKWPTTSPGLRR